MMNLQVENFSYKSLGDRGQLTLDFLFGTVLVLGIAICLAALCFALTLAETFQYIAFSSARAYFAGDLKINDQTTVANAKAESLLKGQGALPFISGAVDSGWITYKNLGPRNYGQDYRALGVDTLRNSFVGVQFQVNFPLMSLKIPIFSAALEGPDGGDFSARISSYLLREPSTEECLNLVNTVYPTLIQLNPAFSQAIGGGASTISPAQFKPILDNGC